MNEENKLPKSVQEHAAELTAYYRGLPAYAKKLSEHKKAMAAWVKENPESSIRIDSLKEAVQFYTDHPGGWAIFATPDETGYVAILRNGWVKAIWAGYRVVIHDAWELRSSTDAIEEV